MALYQVKLPKMGESVAEATITKWLKAEGDAIAIDEELVEIATDKVDSDVTSEVEGVLKELHFKENEVVPVGAVMAVIETDNTLSDHLIQEEDIIEQEKEIHYKESPTKPFTHIPNLRVEGQLEGYDDGSVDGNDDGYSVG